MRPRYFTSDGEPIPAYQCPRCLAGYPAGWPQCLTCEVSCEELGFHTKDAARRTEAWIRSKHDRADD